MSKAKLRKSAFLTELDVELKPGSDDIWVLKSDLWYYSARLKSIIIVPAGVHSDGASVPRIPIIYELYGNRAHREGFLHDYLYRIGAVPEIGWMSGNLTFLEAMTSRKKPWYVRFPMFWGVCLAGYFYYHTHRVQDIL